jgi:protein-disulfide isomerase-like protein with CxxC motif
MGTDLVTKLRAAGITLSLDGGNLVATPKAAITDELRSLIRAHKADILAALAQEQAAAQDLREAFEERAAVLQHDAGLPRADAELEAARITATYARNRGYLWATLRAALAGYPSLLAQVPDRPGPVDSLPFGTATVHVREGAKPGPVSDSIVITEAEIEAARARAAPW